MFWSFCAPKGGVGTSVVAAATALESSKRSPTLLIDFGGDLAQVFGLDTDERHGVHDWLAASTDVGVEALDHLIVDISETLALLPAGSTRPRGVGPERVVQLVDAAIATGRATIADVGTIASATDPLAIVCVSGDRTTCVLRACYLALRRFSKLPVLIDDVVEIEEPGRALRTLDIEAVVGMPVAARIPFDPSIARAVDAGLLSTRMPRSLRRNVGVLLRDADRLAVVR